MKDSNKNEAVQDQHELIGVSDSERDRREFRRNQHPDAQWFGNAGLGLFIHWGISSVHGRIDLSWGMMAGTPWDAALNNRNKITPSEYFRLAERFQPDRYDPDKWLRAAREAGFRYAVMTTKHHDGYALWPSKFGEFGTKTHMGGRDLVAPYVEACRKNGLKVGLYYSPPDWYYNRNHMSFHYGSGNEDRFPGRQHYGLDHEPIESIPPKTPEFQAEYERYLRGQIEELLTEYGRIDVLFFDGGPEVISFERIRELQPGIVVNPRMHGYGDYQTPECRMPNEPIEGWWELCDIWQEGPWGYVETERYKPTAWMLSRLSRVRSWGGNFLVNVSPRPNGELPESCFERMSELAQWMEHSSEAIFDVEPAPFPTPCNVPVTTKGKTWYLHLLPSFQDTVILTDADEPVQVKLLSRSRDVEYVYESGKVRIDIPMEWRSNLVDVIKVVWR